MATIINDRKSGSRTIQFVAPDGKKRPKIRLGKVSKRDARGFKSRLEALIASKIVGGSLDRETAEWLSKLPEKLYARLVKLGLTLPRKNDEVRMEETLEAFLRRYVAGRTDVKPNTLIVYGQTQRCLVEHFGGAKQLAEITAGDADAWRIWLGSQGLSENTVRRRCGFAKQFLQSALRLRLIAENPFADIGGTTVRANRDRDFFVTREMADAVLEACPDVEWRLLFVLSRFGGLRCPSEHLRLRWSDVDWAKGRLLVTSPKTEHLQGKATRTIPLFPELKIVLSEAFEQAEESADFVISRYRSTNANLRTQFSRIIRRAGLKQWPRLFHNLRATRQTELSAEFPLHVVCEWLGNSGVIAQEHYLRVTEADFGRAVRNVVQHPSVISCTELQRVTARNKNTPEIPGHSAQCETVRKSQVDRGGIEPPTPGFSVLCSTC